MSYPLTPPPSGPSGLGLKGSPDSTSGAPVTRPELRALDPREAHAHPTDPQEDLQRTKMQLKAALEINSLLISASRQMEEPVRTLAGMLQPLGLGEPLQREALETLLHAARDLQTLVGRMTAAGAEVSRSQASGQAAPRPRPRIPVLYVEDNPQNLQLMERILACRGGLELFSTAQGQMALPLARQHAPELILLDLNLPDMHGSEVLRRLREDPLTRGIPVMVISADATPAQMTRMLAAGARGYLTKPYDVRRFLSSLDQILGPAQELITA